MNKSPF